MTGIIIGNRYELIDRVGSGGMAIVYKARCRLLNRFVAVKMLRPEFNDDIEFLKRFETEAQAAASLSHANVVSVYDVGTHEKIHYIVMEYVEGATLKEYMTENGPLPVDTIFDFSLQIASALEHAHSKKIIHHDIKPHNIIITAEGLLKVTDFGLARAASAATTVAGNSAIGSVHYASPEQARGGFTDEKSDIYSLGVTMYEMAAGRVPFDGDTPVSVAMKHLQKEPTAPSRIRASVPQSVEAIILKAMEKEPRMRYQNAGEILEDIRRASEGTYVSGRPAGEEDKFSTKRMPEVAAAQNEPKEPAEIIEDVKEKKGVKTKKKEDTIAIIAAIVTTVAIVVVLGIIVVQLLNSGALSGEIKVPNLLNLSYEDAQRIAGEEGFTVTIEESEHHDTVLENRVISQSPKEDEKVAEAGEIRLVMSLGTTKVFLNDYRGWEYKKVVDELNDLGIKYRITENYDEDIDEGLVINTDPAANEEILDGKSVMINVSLGKEEVARTAPALAGKTKDEAEDLLKENKLIRGNVSYEESDEEAGKIIRQSPTSGSKVIEGSSVDIVISSGRPSPPPSPSPPASPSPAANEPDDTHTNEQSPPPTNSVN